MVVLKELGVKYPVPALDNPALSDQSEQRCWGRAQAGDEAVGGIERLAITGARCDHFRNPAGAVTVGLDVTRRNFRPQSPADVTAMADLVIRCNEREMALSKQLIGSLAVDTPLVGLDRH